MSIAMKLMETVNQAFPDRKTDLLITGTQALGKPLSRVDGPVKVSGEARFTADVPLDQMAYATMVCSTIAKGRITRIDEDEA